jgi:hypothetical protein
MTFALSVFLKATAILATASAASRVSRRSSAAARHVLWCLAIASLGALPLLSAALPRLELPILAAADPGQPGRGAVQVEVVPAGASSAVEVSPRPPGDPWGWLVLVWLGGWSLGWIHLACGIGLATRAVRRSRPVGEPGWSDLLVAAKAELGVRRPVALRVSEAIDVPVVCGYRSATILLPPGALDWPQERRRTALLHELGHVARFDCLTQSLAYAVRAFYWPHPLAWWAVASLRRESEKACDDCVVRSGAAASEYARHLLDAARARPAHRLMVAAAGAERTHLGARVGALLDDEQDRRAPARATTLFSSLVALSLSALLAATWPVAAASPAQDADLAGWIDHEPVGCLVEGRFADIDARIVPAPTQARLFFASGRAPGDREYWVGMTREGDRYVAHLPKPKADASPVRYRIEARDARGRAAGTDRYVAVVARDVSRCPRATRVAPETTGPREVTVHTGADAPPVEPSEDPTLEAWISHAPIGCLVQGRFPEIAAEIDPASAVVEARLYFASEASDAEYWTSMSRVGDRFVTRLPKPRLEAGRIRYRIEARRDDGRLASTDGFLAVVASDESSCPAGARVAAQAASIEVVTVY